MTRTPEELDNTGLVDALKKLDDQLQFTTSCLEKNWSVFSDDQIRNMHENYTKLRNECLKVLKFRGCELLKK